MGDHSLLSIQPGYDKKLRKGCQLSSRFQEPFCLEYSSRHRWYMSGSPFGCWEYLYRKKSWTMKHPSVERTRVIVGEVADSSVADVVCSKPLQVALAGRSVRRNSGFSIARKIVFQKFFRHTHLGCNPSREILEPSLQGDWSWGPREARD